MSKKEMIKQMAAARKAGNLKLANEIQAQIQDNMRINPIESLNKSWLSHTRKNK